MLQVLIFNMATVIYQRYDGLSDKKIPIGIRTLAARQCGSAVSLRRNISLCSLGLSANQPAVVFSRTKSALATSPPATSQSAILFSHNKSAPAISYNRANTAILIDALDFMP